MGKRHPGHKVAVGAALGVVGSRWVGGKRGSRGELALHARSDCACCTVTPTQCWNPLVVAVVDGDQSLNSQNGKAPLPGGQAGRNKLVVSWGPLVIAAGRACSAAIDPSNGSSRGIELASEWSITASARTSNFQNGRFRSSQWFPDKATSAQTNSRAPSVVLNQIDDLCSPSTFHRARDRRSSCWILACHPLTHARLRLSCGAHPR